MWRLITIMSGMASGLVAALFGRRAVAQTEDDDAMATTAEVPDDNGDQLSSNTAATAPVTPPSRVRVPLVYGDTFSAAMVDPQPGRKPFPSSPDSIVNTPQFDGPSLKLKQTPHESEADINTDPERTSTSAASAVAAPSTDEQARKTLKQQRRSSSSAALLPLIIPAFAAVALSGESGAVQSLQDALKTTEGGTSHHQHQHQHQHLSLIHI